MRGRLPESPARSRQLGRKVREGPPAGPRASLRPPGGLPMTARQVWERDAPRVPGGLRTADSTAFANLCRVQALTEALLTRAETAIDAEAGAARTPQSLWAAVRLARLSAELRRPFGLAPMDRQRLLVAPDLAEDDLERFRRANPPD
jgi:phage terminase small subunit